MNPTALCYFDLETTGTDPYSDRIVELYMRRESLDPGAPGPFTVHRFVDPGCEVPDSAVAVHGLDWDALVLTHGAKPLEHWADEIEQAVDGAVLVGFNSRSFDVPLLHQELRRIGRDGLPVDDHGMIDVPEIDLYRLWQSLEPRTLAGALQRYLGLDLENAHSAEADVEHLPELLWAMCPVAPGPGAIQHLQELSADPSELDRAGKFRREEDGTVVFNFGKHQGRPCLADHDTRGYLSWMLKKDFPPDTKVVASRLLRGEDV